jgi:NAD(P)-dependent dehydrogenase (short-subunit alcohol dehydrogenase family)
VARKLAGVGVAVVTGGTRGIGLEIARALRDLGHRTVVLARTVDGRTEPGVEPVACDVTDARAVEAAFSELGPVDVVVNNAGVASSDRLSRTSLDEWQRNLAVNATGPFLCTRAVIDGMLERGYGRIVTVASTASLTGVRYTAAYTASKHAVLGLMRVVAAEVAGTGVTANSVCPTFVRTDMTLETIRTIAERTRSDATEAEARLVAMTPHARLLEPGEVADAVLALIDSDDNGREVVLDGRPALQGGSR